MEAEGKVGNEDLMQHKTHKAAHLPNHSEVEKVQNLHPEGTVLLYLFHIVSSLRTCLNKHHIQLFGSLLTFFRSDLPGQTDANRKERAREGRTDRREKA